jgi:hypothetical protein
MAALQHDGRPGQARPAAAARSRGELQPLIGIIGQHQRRPRLAGLLARPPPAPLPQRPVPRLLLIRAIRGRRPRRGRGVLARSALQMLHPCPQLPDQLVRPGQQRRELRMREPLQLRRRGGTGHIRHSTQINPSAGPQSTTRHGVSPAHTGTARRPGETPRRLLNSYLLSAALNRDATPTEAVSSKAAGRREPWSRTSQRPRPSRQLRLRARPERRQPRSARR